VLLDNDISFDTGYFHGIKDKTAFVKYAILMKNFDLLEFLLKNNACLIDLEILRADFDLDFLPPLHYAVLKYKNIDDLKLITILLQYGSKVNFHDCTHIFWTLKIKLNMVFFVLFSRKFTTAEITMLLEIFDQFGLNIITWNSVGLNYTTIQVLEYMVKDLLKTNEFHNALCVNHVVNFLNYQIEKKTKSFEQVSKLVIGDTIDTLNIMMFSHKFTQQINQQH
jgi:hypothetical protein